MGCAVSKGAALGSPGYEVSSASGYEVVSGSASASASIWSRPVRLEALDLGEHGEEEAGEKKGGNNVGGTARLGNLHRYIECEQAAAGWPAWLSAVAAEAVQGWVPLKAENFEKLDKIGQGTYSSVFRARSLETGRVVALKKVRFDSVEPESVRFMAREIIVLRRLQGHPNVIGLHGLITSCSSASIYLVFEYMEHDLAGLASSPDLSFSQPQIKCFMWQLLAGLEHCHARGVMHRDIKCANLLVSSDGVLKVADFGLANLFSTSQPLTSRVVTLWYRPPELLLGATAYDPSVDLWSAGCVFGELHARRPVLQGRTEVEQIHKIFKLCGSPPDEYWRRSGMTSHASVFRPQAPYESRLGETFGSAMPDAAFRLLGTLLSVEPAARGTASAALASDYFTTEPYACEPSSLPKCAPNKEMDAKFREESRRRNAAPPPTKRLSRAHKSMQDTSQRHHGHVHAEESLPLEAGGGQLRPEPATVSKRHDNDAPQPAPPCGRQMSRSYQEEEALADHLTLSAGPVQLAASTGFAWAKKPRVPDDQEELLQGSKEQQHRRRRRRERKNGRRRHHSSIRGGEAGDDQAVGAGRRGFHLIRSLQQQVHQRAIGRQAAQDQQEVQGEDGEGGLLGAVAVGAPARRRAPAQPRAADPASRPPVMVPQREQEGAATLKTETHTRHDHHVLLCPAPQLHLLMQTESWHRCPTRDRPCVECSIDPCGNWDCLLRNSKVSNGIGTALSGFFCLAKIV